MKNQKKRNMPKKKVEERTDMVLRCGAPAGWVSYPGQGRSACRVTWTSREKTASGLSAWVRLPEERHRRYDLANGFEAAGKHYEDLLELFAAHDHSYTWCRDKYGREVLCLVEIWAAFDIYDVGNEDRFYRWFFLREGGKLTRVHYPGEGRYVYVTEDVAYLEEECWDEMESLGYGGDNEPWPEK